VSEEVKMFFLKVVAEVANASEKKRKLNNIYEEGMHNKGVETNTTQSGIEGKKDVCFKRNRKSKICSS